MKKRLIVITGILMVLMMVLNACAPSTVETNTPENTESEEVNADTETESEDTEEVEETAAESEETAEEQTAEESAMETIPQGGNFIIAMNASPDTLDPQTTGLADSFSVIRFLYNVLITKHPDTGEYIPSLATDWEISDDGLVYTFTLRDDVSFHNGDTLTAADVVYSYERATDPDMISPTTGALLASMENIAALDDYTVEFTLSKPSYYFLESLATEGYMGILNQRAVEEAGDQYGYNPVGTGPFMFKEWLTGDRIVLERNPDFVWGPEYTNGTPPNIETVTFRIIPETATIIAGLESGEIHTSGIQYRDVENLEETGMFTILKSFAKGMQAYFTLNVSQPPFDDINLRKALNLAVDKKPLIEIINPGDKVQNGPLSPSTEGYWDGIEELGYSYDLEQARQILLDTGYTYNDENMLEKDGEPVAFEIACFSELAIKAGEVVQSQWKELGIDVTLSQVEIGVFYDQLVSGDYAITLMGYGWPTADMLWYLFHTDSFGVENFSRYSDPEMDELLDEMMTTTNYETHMEAAKNVQIKVVEEAIVVPLFVGTSYQAVSVALDGYKIGVFSGGLELYDAYFVE